MKKWLDKYQSKGEVKKQPKSNFNPYTNVNRIGVSENTNVYKNTFENDKEEKYNASVKFQREHKTPVISKTPDNYNTPSMVALRKHYKDVDNNKKILRSILKGADITTDLMQLGNFSPDPISQTIGGIGNIVGMGVDAFQVGMDLREGNYNNAAINAASVILPTVLDSKSFRRNSKYLQPGQTLYPLSPQARGSIDRVNYIEPFTKVKGMTDASLYANRALLGALGAETIIDLKQNGGLVSKNSLNRTVKCSNCGWSWKLSDGGEDPLTCHKCGGTIKMKNGGIIEDDMGQWAHPGQVTKINSNEITMEGVPYPVLGVDNTGYAQMMQPQMNYTFPGQYVIEYPMAQNGKEVKKSNIRQAYVDAYNNYNNRTFPAETLPQRQKAYRTINPSDYTDLRNYGRWISDEKRNEFFDPRSEEAFKFYLGLSKPEDLQYIRKSQYRPTINPTDKYYYAVDPELEQDIFNAYKDKVKLNETLQTDEAEFETALSGKGAAGLLGRFGVSKGHDENGDYLSYYDKYDLKDFAQDRTKGVPYSIYNRIYYPKKEQGGEMINYKSGGQHGGLDRWFAEKWVDIKTGKPCGRQEGEDRNYPACRPSKRISSATPKTASELSSSEKQKFKQEKTSSQRISYNHKRMEYGGENIDNMNYMKSGGNVPTNPELWSRAKSAARSKYDVYPCVPMDSQALTKEGWKHYNELSIGEDILAYNQETNKNEWTPIISLQKFEDAPIIRLYKSQTNFDIKCTPNHKWVLAESNSKYPDNFVEAKDITKHMKIKISAELSDNGNGLNLNTFFKKDSWVKNILKMSISQIQSYFASGIVYDGHDKGLTKKEDKQTYGFSQKEKDHGLAMEIAAVLLGYRVCSVIKKHNPTMMSWTFIKRNTESTQNLHKEDAGTSDVWCPTTKFGTWVMKQNGYVTITGNSAYANGFAAKWYKSHGGGWRKAAYGMEVMANGGIPNNSGFNALPQYVQQNIINNMATGGQKMPPKLAYARFAAAGNLNQLGRYGYQDGGEEEDEKEVYWRTKKPMVNDPSMDAISKVLLQRNQDKNFMQRAAGLGNQNGIPTRYIDGENPNSNDMSTLLMGFDNNYVSPTIIETFSNPLRNNSTMLRTAPGQLSYQPNQMEEYIKTPTVDIADYFAAKGYKRAANDMYGTNYKQGGSVTLNTSGEKHKIYVKTTNRGEGAKGHIMVNHPTMDKGMWDTIDLTEKAGAKTIAQGVAATKKWHRKNPYKKQEGGGIILPNDFNKFQEFNKTLPENLRNDDFKYGDYSHYDLYGMWDAAGKPNSFDDVKDSENFRLQEDGTYHGFSVGNDGVWLKPKSHPSAFMEYMQGQLNPDPYFLHNHVIQKEDGRLQYVPNNYITKQSLKQKNETDIPQNINPKFMYSAPPFVFANGGGIPERYRNMGFTKVGAKKQSTRPGKKWMVLAKKGDDYKVVHGGYKGMQDFKQHHSEQRKENFWSRMGGRNSSKATDPFSPLYWHKRFGTWEQGGQIPMAQDGLYVNDYIDLYNNLYNKSKKYLNRDVFKGTPLKGEDFAKAIVSYKLKTGYEYPLDLLLAQAQQETRLGTNLKSKHNYFNVGNYDDGRTKDFTSPQESILNYMDLVYNDYLQKGNKDYHELLADKGYVNTKGNRYASDPLYEKKLKDQSEYIKKFMNKKKKGGQYMAIGGQNVMNPIVKKDNRNWLEYLKN